MCFFSFFFYCYRALRSLHSFPTRRSSDLKALFLSRVRSLTKIAIALSSAVALVGCGGFAEWIAVRVFYREAVLRSEEHTSELQSLRHLVCRLLLEKKKRKKSIIDIDVREN